MLAADLSVFVAVAAVEAGLLMHDDLPPAGSQNIHVSGLQERTGNTIDP